MPRTPEQDARLRELNTSLSRYEPNGVSMQSASFTQSPGAPPPAPPAETMAPLPFTPPPAPAAVPQPVQAAPVGAPPPAPTPAPVAAPPETDTSPEAAAKAKERQRIGKLEPWTDIPELNSPMGSHFLEKVGSNFITNPERLKTMFKHSFPGVKVDTVDDSVILTSRVNGKQYAWRSGLEKNDITRGLTAAAITIPATMAAAAALPVVAPAAAAALPAAGTLGSAVLAGAGHGLMNAVVSEGAQAAGGAGFDPTQLLVQPAIGAALPVVGKGLSTLRYAAFPAAAEAEAARIAATRSAAPAAARAATTAEQDFMQGSRGSIPAQQSAARRIGVDPAMEAAAAVHRVESDLSPSIMGGTAPENIQARKIVQQIESAGGSTARQATDAGVEAAAQKIRTNLEQVGARPISEIAPKIRKELGDTYERLVADREAKYADLVPPQTPVHVQSAIDAINAWEANNPRTLPPSFAAARTKLARETIREGGKVKKLVDPTWGTLDTLTKRAIADAGAPQIGTDITGGEREWLAMLLRDTRDHVAEQLGAGPKLEAAKASHVALKTFEDHLETLLGQQLRKAVDSGDVFKRAASAISAAAQGHDSGFRALVGAMSELPMQTRRDLMASALLHEFENAGQGQPISFAKVAQFFRQIESQPAMGKAIMLGMSVAQRSRFRALGELSKGIVDTLKMRTRTGTSVMESMKRLAAAEGLTDRMVTFVGDLAPRAGSAGGAVAGATAAGAAGGNRMTAATGGSFVGGVVGKLIRGALGAVGTTREEALDALLVSPAFKAMVKTGTGSVPVTPNIAKRIAAGVANSAPGRRLANAINMPISELQQGLLNKVLIPAAGMAEENNRPIEEAK